MNKYHNILKATVKKAEANHCMTVKLKYGNKWLQGGTSIFHPVYAAYEKEFIELSYTAIRKIVKKYYPRIRDLKELKAYLSKDNKEKFSILFPGEKYEQ